ncbi:MAG: hypothetical protein PVJ27_00170 [Candidatus Brocadiaceae bacterium]
MARTSVCVVVLVIGVGMLAGCASPTREELESADRTRAEISEVVEQFADALRSKSVTGLRALLAPSLPPSERMRLCVAFEQSSWLKRHSDYAVEEERASAEVDSGDWAGGCFWLGLPEPERGGGDRRLKLVRQEGRWWIEDIELPQPVSGDRLDPPEDVAARLRAQVLPIMEALRGGHIGEVYYRLPDKPACRYRLPELTFMQKLIDRPGAISIFSDLQAFDKLDFIAWPDPSDPLEIVYLAPGSVAAVYRLPYSWGGEEPTEPELLDLKLVFMKQREGWTFYRIEMSGKAIPYS